MRKIIVLAVLAVLFVLMVPMAPRVYATAVPFTTTIPVAIAAGGNVTIIVSNIGGDEPFSVFYWQVTRPDGTQDEVHPAGEVINPGNSVSHTYPADFGGDTSQPGGLYTVHFGILVGPGLVQRVSGVPFVVATPFFCFIATAAYGTPMAEEIQVLRDFRDQYLITNSVGEKLVSTYYRVSPPLAEYIVEHPSLKPLVRFALQPAIVFSSVAINTTPMEKIAIALVILTLLFVMRERKGQRKAT